MGVNVTDGDNGNVIKGVEGTEGSDGAGGCDGASGGEGGLGRLGIVIADGLIGELEIDGVRALFFPPLFFPPLFFPPLFFPPPFLPMIRSRYSSFEYLSVERLRFPTPLSCPLGSSADGGVTGLLRIGASVRSHSDTSLCLLSSLLLPPFFPPSIPRFPARPNSGPVKRVAAQLPRNGYSDLAIAAPNTISSISSGFSSP